MKKIVVSVAMVVILCLGVFVGVLQIKPNLRPADAAEDAAFQSVLEDVSSITAVPHTAGSAENAVVRDFIRDRAGQLGFTAEVQPFKMDVKTLVAEWVQRYETGSDLYRQRMETYIAEGSYASLEEMVRGRMNAGTEDFLQLDNILIKIAGSAPTGSAMFVSHYDSVNTAPGAADDGLAVACMLQLMEKFAGKAPVNDVYLLITDGEENGLLGAAEFVKANPGYAQEVDVLFNFEARGNSGALLMFETAGNDYELVKRFSSSVPQPVALSVATAIYETMPNGTDFSEFKEAGYYGLNFAMIEGDENYHQPTDTLENLNKDTAYQYYQTMMALGDYFSGANLGEITHVQDASFFPLPLVGVLVIPGPLARVLGFVPLLLAAGLMLQTLRRKEPQGGGRIPRLVWLFVLGALPAAVTLLFFPGSYLFVIPSFLFLLTDVALSMFPDKRAGVAVCVFLISVFMVGLVFTPITVLVQVALKMWPVTVLFAVLPAIPAVVYGVKVLKRV